MNLPTSWRRLLAALLLGLAAPWLGAIQLVPITPTAFSSPVFLTNAGDGTSGNDPPNNAQNIDVLLGKILRIDVDHPDTTAGTAYSSPADNPYVGTGGRDEIFSIGWRNPWRFSFDRQSGQQWVGDVGQ